MEYEFIHDSITGSAKAKFSFEHQVIGPWLEVEIGKNIEKLTEILTAIDDVELIKSHEVVIAGHEYSLLLNKNDAQIQANGALSEEPLPEEFANDDMNFDTQEVAKCGVSDLRMLLLSWSKFVKN